MTDTHRTVLKAAAILWVVWGAVHLFAGIMTIVSASDPQTAIGNIADAVDKAGLAASYPAALSGILSQHGWNLGWFGVTTIVGAWFIWRANMTAIWVTALVGGLADVGYFLYIDLPGYANFVPGTVMTIVSATAILLSVWVWSANRSAASTAAAR